MISVCFEVTPRVVITVLRKSAWSFNLMNAEMFIVGEEGEREYARHADYLKRLAESK